MLLSCSHCAPPDYNRGCRHREKRVFCAMCAPACPLRAALPDPTSNKLSAFFFTSPVGSPPPKDQSLTFAKVLEARVRISAAALELSDGERLAEAGATVGLCRLGCSHSLPFISAQWTELRGERGGGGGGECVCVWGWVGGGGGAGVGRQKR